MYSSFLANDVADGLGRKNKLKIVVFSKDQYMIVSINILGLVSRAAPRQKQKFRNSQSQWPSILAKPLTE